MLACFVALRNEAIIPFIQSMLKYLLAFTETNGEAEVYTDWNTDLSSVANQIQLPRKKRTVYCYQQKDIWLFQPLLGHCVIKNKIF
jgi:hypothetical protein